MEPQQLEKEWQTLKAEIPQGEDVARPKKRKRVRFECPFVRQEEDDNQAASPSQELSMPAATPVAVSEEPLEDVPPNSISFIEPMPTCSEQPPLNIKPETDHTTENDDICPVDCDSNGSEPRTVNHIQTIDPVPDSFVLNVPVVRQLLAAEMEYQRIQDELQAPPASLPVQDCSETEALQILISQHHTLGDLVSEMSATNRALMNYLNQLRGKRHRVAGFA